MTAPPITGGCQCGAVRYAVSAPLTNVHLCHCRMCQRAVGNAFAALAAAPREALTWTKGAPAAFRSSNLATRGFCRDCGTPLTFAYDHAARISLTLGSLDDPEAAPIQAHYGVESRLSWLKLCDGLPATETSDGGSGLLAQLEVRQAGEGA
jgi:hypothetical protein